MFVVEKNHRKYYVRHEIHRLYYIGYFLLEKSAREIAEKLDLEYGEASNKARFLKEDIFKKKWQDLESAASLPDPAGSKIVL